MYSYIFTVPTAVRETKAVPSSPESIFITWDHPEYPNSQLMDYIIFYSELSQSNRKRATNVFNRTVGTVTSHNLTGLDPFTNYGISLTVRAMDVAGEAPIEGDEIEQRTNTTSK